MPDVVTTALVLAHPAPAGTALVLGLPLPSVTPPVEVSGSVLLLPLVSGQGEAWSVAPLLSTVQSLARASVQSARVAAALAWRTSRAASGAASAWGQARQLQSARLVHWIKWRALRTARFAAWRHGALVRAVQRLTRAQGGALRWSCAMARRGAAPASSMHMQHWGPAVRLARVSRPGWAPFVRAAAGRCIVWRKADRIARQLHAALPGTSVLVSVGAWPSIVVVPAPCCTVDTAMLLQALAPASSALVLICDRDVSGQQPAAVIVRPRGAYLVGISTHLRRADTGQIIPVPAFNLTLDLDSFAWRLTASGIPPDAEPVLMDEALYATPLVLHINGTEIALVTRSLSSERVFGARGLSLSALSPTCLLDDPFAASTVHTSSVLRSAAQIADDAVSVAGVSAGWAVDFQLDDWIVAAGAWSHAGTPLSALQAIAAAAGGTVQPHDVDAVVRVMHRWPVAPWDWSSATPDVELPAAAVQREGVERFARPLYNRAFVAGASSGARMYQVTRAGTAGDKDAPAVTDPLITDTPAGLQRARALLADTGPQEAVTLRLPVLTQTGILRPGQLIRYVDGTRVRLGLARGVSVSRDPGQLWQTVALQTFV